MADDRYVRHRESLVLLQDDFVEEFERRMKEMLALLTLYSAATRRILVSIEERNVPGLGVK